MNLGALPSHAKLELRVLGTGEVWRGNQRSLVGHRKTLALLAFLALEGETARSTLTTLFWSDNTEEAARRNLRRELHRLREAGLRDAIEASNDHLRLVGLTTTDVQQFESLDLLRKSGVFRHNRFHVRISNASRASAVHETQ